MPQINLNIPGELSLESLAALIASKDDSAHRQLRVTNQGIAYLSDDVGAKNIDGLAFRYETWSAGTDCVGKHASKDLQFIQALYDSLKSNWPTPSDTYIDQY